MEKFGSVEETLDFAIAREEESSQFYSELASKMEKPYMQEVFEKFSKEEIGHKNKLMNIKDNNQLAPAAGKVMDLKIGDYLVDIEPSPDMDYQDALIMAMKKEKAAFRLYNDLSATTDDGNLRTLFQTLAQEEAKHKLRFEVEYDEYFLAED